MGCQARSIVKETQVTCLQALTSTKQGAGTELVPRKCAEQRREEPVLQPALTEGGPRVHLGASQYCFSSALFDPRLPHHAFSQSRCPVQHPSGTEEQWDGCTAPQEHSTHLQAAADCSPTAPHTE